MIMQELIEAEATERIGADKFERTESPHDRAQRERDRLLATQAGEVKLRIRSCPRGRSPGDPRVHESLRRDIL